jgi:hypothetical protein
MTEALSESREDKGVILGEGAAYVVRDELSLIGNANIPWHTLYKGRASRPVARVFDGTIDIELGG